MTEPGSDPASQFFRARLESVIEREIGGLTRGARIVDIGCGLGYWLEYFRAAGVDRVCGIDLNPQRARRAKERAHGAQIVVGDARELPWPDGAFDLVMQFVVFSSLPEWEDRQRMAGEMLRVLKPGGRILWYDFFAPNPWNRQTKPVRRDDVARLFAGSRVRWQKVTLAPPLARLALGVSSTWAENLDRFTFLRTHYFAVIEPGEERT